LDKEGKDDGKRTVKTYEDVLESIAVFNKSLEKADV